MKKILSIVLIGCIFISGVFAEIFTGIIVEVDSANNFYLNINSEIYYCIFPTNPVGFEIIQEPIINEGFTVKGEKISGMLKNGKSIIGVSECYTQAFKNKILKEREDRRLRREWEEKYANSLYRIQYLNEFTEIYGKVLHSVGNSIEVEITNSNWEPIEGAFYVRRDEDIIFVPTEYTIFIKNSINIPIGSKIRAIVSYEDSNLVSSLIDVIPNEVNEGTKGTIKECSCGAQLCYNDSHVRLSSSSNGKKYAYIECPICHSRITVSIEEYKGTRRSLNIPVINKEEFEFKYTSNK